jgi:hypothetical protein
MKKYAKTWASWRTKQARGGDRDDGWFSFAPRACGNRDDRRAEHQRREHLDARPRDRHRGRIAADDLGCRPRVRPDGGRIEPERREHAHGDDPRRQAGRRRRRAAPPGGPADQIDHPRRAGHGEHVDAERELREQAEQRRRADGCAHRRG